MHAWYHVSIYIYLYTTQYNSCVKRGWWFLYIIIFRMQLALHLWWMHCTCTMSGNGDSLPLILIGHSTAGYMHCWHQLLTVGQDYILLQNPETSLRSGEGLPSAEMFSCCRLYRACARLRIMISYVVYASVTLVYWPDAAASFHSPIELISWTFTIHRFPVQLVSISSSALWKEGRHISSHHCIHPFERESYHDDLPHKHINNCKACLTLQGGRVDPCKWSGPRFL